MDEDTQDSYVESPIISGDDGSFGDEPEGQEPEIEIEYVDEDGEPEQSEDAGEVVEQETPEAPKKSHKPRPKTKERIKELYKEKSIAEREAASLRVENERLRKASEESAQAAMSHYDKSIELRKHNAIRAKTDAIIAGDVEAQVQADVELSRVAAQLENVEAWKFQETAKQQQYEQDRTYRQQQAQHQSVEINDDAQEWLQENTWFDPRSQDFEPDIANEVQAYATALERKYARNGMADKIMTREYFDEINNYVQNEFYEQEDAPEPEPVQRQQTRGPTMSQSKTRAPTAAVGRTGQQAKAQISRQKVTLSPEEREVARMWKIKEDSYAQHKVSTTDALRKAGKL